LKKEIISIAIMSIIVSQCVPAFAAEYNVSKYNVSVASQLKVPFESSEKGYFEGGLVTGFGSAVTFKGYNENGEMQFYAITDRGPNADAPKYTNGSSTTDAKIFPCPDFTPSIGIITVTENGAVVNDAITLKNAAGENISGLPVEPGKVGSTGESALSMNLKNIGYDNDGLDTEGIAVDTNGNFWMCDEYGPFLVKADSNGNIVEKYAPGNGLPEILKYRIPNRGFEGLTITPSGKVLVSEQSVLNVNGETSKTACFTRIVEFDPATKETKTYAYPVDVSKYKSPSDCKIGDIYAIDDNTLLVIQQGKLADKTMTNIVYKVDLSNADDISNMTYNGKELEYASANELSNIKFAEKEPLIDLRAYGWTAEKAEGICMTDKNTIAVINDNDFGIATLATDAENNNVDITDYVYNAETGKYTLDGVDANINVSIEENTEPAQIWIFKANEDSKPEKYMSLRNIAVNAASSGNQFSVNFNNSDKTVNITTGEKYNTTGIEKGDDYITSVKTAETNWSLNINGNKTNIKIYNINGYNYVSLSEFETATGIKIS